MTTAQRIVVTEASVYAALAEWHAERTAAEREHDAQAVQRCRDKVYRCAPHDFARELAPYVFSLLVKHAESPGLEAKS